MLRVVVWMEQLVWRCISAHRVRIVQIVHPLSVILMLLAIGFFVIYELFYILPECSDVSGVYYKFHCLFMMFLLHNIIGNMVMCWRTDTSFVGLPLDRLNPTPAEAHLWHLCTHCQMLVPPRAWHCRLCNCCMLKRDHHCNVTGNCIGHANQRYFVGLLLHLSLGCCTALAYNVYHLFSQHSQMFSDPIQISMDLDTSNLMNMLFTHKPLSPQLSWMLITGGILKLNIFALVLACAHLIIQLYMASRGSCLYCVYDRSYDLGFWNNMQTVLGKRMFWIALSPFVSSPLPHDGTQWLADPHKPSGKKPV